MCQIAEQDVRANQRRGTIMNFFARLMLASSVFSLSACGGGGGGGSASANNAPFSNSNQTSSCSDGSSSQLASISGRITFDRVPLSTVNNGLEYHNASVQPSKGISVQLLNCADTLIGQLTTDANGEFNTQVPAGANIKVAIRAEMRDPSGQNRWFVQVRNNQANNALYIVTTTINIGGEQPHYDIHLPSGWNGSSLSGTRFAAPFAILDTIAKTSQAVLLADNTVELPPLNVFWSTNNTNTTIGSSHHSGGQIFLLGEKNVDTDEYDEHVIAHEWAHYMEYRLGRSDSVGGKHGSGDKLDKRVAFSEALGNAFSGMATNDPHYRDSKGYNQGTGFTFNVEANVHEGWYSEASVQSILYDIFDHDHDGSDQLTMGFKPIYQTLTDASYIQQASRTSIFSFLTILKQRYPSAAAQIDELADARGLNSTDSTLYADFETNNAGNMQDVLPLYRSLDLDGPLVEVCSTDEYGTRNKLSVSRFVRFEIPVAGVYTIRVDPVSAGTPRWFLSKNEVIIGGSNSSRATVNLAAGKYILDIADNAIALGNESANRRVCYHASVSQ